ncbi:hypothetical protein [Haloarchaeobius amylolyticus]|uniref:hypothetical protein n=1 Tax=Haloarchaeobius amylolyticus TaxID=1198296 RepID=UPI002271E383|nr:hypothetical protein [Haloarchaeobius amylolyticus]
MRPTRTLTVLVVLLLVAAPVLAHVPNFPVDNTSPEQAVEVPDAVKSWSFYDRLGDGGAKYYRVTLSPGERLQVGTFTPRGGEFTPSLVVMSPSLEGTGDVPAGVTVPEGMGAVVVEGERPASASYEPFAPSANYHTAEFSRQVETETTYLVAVYEPANRSGPAGVALGYSEQFSPVEYAMVPFDLVRTHLWAGQHPLVVLGPMLLALVAGASLTRNRWREDWGSVPARLLLAGGGLFVLGSGLNTALQMGFALLRTGPTAGAVVTGLFVVVPVLCGGWALGLALRGDLELTAGRRAGIAAAGGLALLTWAGFIIGPAALLVVAVAPGRVLKT